MLFQLLGQDWAVRTVTVLIESLKFMQCVTSTSYCWVWLRDADCSPDWSTSSYFCAVPHLKAAFPCCCPNRHRQQVQHDWLTETSCNKTSNVIVWPYFLKRQKTIGLFSETVRKLQQMAHPTSQVALESCASASTSRSISDSRSPIIVFPAPLLNCKWASENSKLE